MYGIIHYLLLLQVQVYLFPFTHDKAKVCCMLIIVSGICLTQSKLVVVDGNRDLLDVNAEWRESSLDFTCWCYAKIQTPLMDYEPAATLLTL